ncbi:phosphatase 2C-like domain-containing protein [Tribonema minus]|uniref:Phosphatase 2C-like domain-containing protein n=1 Tax=Tribonema minus TaxID=303371 RepID=A0A835Z7U5_9STRA|nr:phosphatase 2C-like domain-containing protein [Tribonema minus]
MYWRGVISTAAAIAGVYCAGGSPALADSGVRKPPAAVRAESTDTKEQARDVPAPAPLFTSVQASKGHRSYMEDDYFLSADGRFAAVYDGHGGASVSKYLRQNLYTQVKANLPLEEQECGEEHIIQALKAAFKTVDDEVLKVRHWSYQGSTAVAVVIHPTVAGGNGNCSIITANVGDSRAVLCRRGKAVEITKDHKPNATAELDRIEALGGNVRWFGFIDPEGRPIEGTGVYRINGNLAVARAIGDSSERPFVSGECEIRSMPMDHEGDQFIIIATDGLWDVMTSDEVVQYVQAVMGGAMGALREGESRGEFPLASDRPVDMKLSDWTQRYADDRGMIRAAMMSRKKKMARYLAQEAIRRGTMDNVTVVVMFFR